MRKSLISVISINYTFRLNFVFKFVSCSHLKRRIALCFRDLKAQQNPINLSAYNYIIHYLYSCPTRVKLRPAEKLLFNLGSDLCNQWLHQRKIKKTMHEAFIDAKKRCIRDFRDVFQVYKLYNIEACIG